MNENTAEVILLILILVLYMLPTLLAFARDIPRRKLVTVINIILGWTLIGWLVAFLWATLERSTPEEIA
ncbi:MAG TPA: superinfection immunity protein [Stellaceae bacterium]|nr:superinfection immunity protein [Stellaceae bacterium]